MFPVTRRASASSRVTATPCSRSSASPPIPSFTNITSCSSIVLGATNIFLLALPLALSSAPSYAYPSTRKCAGGTKPRKPHLARASPRRASEPPSLARGALYALA